MTPLEYIQYQVERACTRDTPLSQLCIDSLDLLQLQLDCQTQFNKTISDEQFLDIHTVGELADALC